ncbi:14109_t:CDS:2 [Funneliformis geosporum]|nr:14109_t:CDS:2 [Funneliformis geosporum]
MPSLDNAVRDYLFKQNSVEYQKQQGEFFILTAVHRLDKLTKGLVIYPKTPAAKRLLYKVISDKSKITKKYFAECENFHNRQVPVFIQGYLGKDSLGQKMVFSLTPYKKAKYCAMEAKEIKRAKSNHLVLFEITLQTGRKHQIRSALAYFGYPIAGDEKYGSKLVDKDKIGLVAYKIIFNELTAPLSYLNRKDVITGIVSGGIYLGNSLKNSSSQKENKPQNPPIENPQNPPFPEKDKSPNSEENSACPYLTEANLTTSNRDYNKMDIGDDLRIGVINELSVMFNFDKLGKDIPKEERKNLDKYVGLTKNMVVIVRKISGGGPIINIDKGQSNAPMTREKKQSVHYTKKIINLFLNQVKINSANYQISVLDSFGVENFGQESKVAYGRSGGKSAGSALYLALLSAYYQKPLSQTVAATGALSLSTKIIKRGKVNEQEFTINPGTNLPVQGLK